MRCNFSWIGKKSDLEVTIRQDVIVSTIKFMRLGLVNQSDWEIVEDLTPQIK